MKDEEMERRLRAGGNTPELALELSIEKWQDIVDGTGENNGIHNCALCRYYQLDQGGCEECPVAIKTGQNYCQGTPYDELRHPIWDEDRRQLLTIKMLEFLKSLRDQPKGPLDDLVEAVKATAELLLNTSCEDLDCEENCPVGNTLCNILIAIGEDRYDPRSDYSGW